MSDIAVSALGCVATTGALTLRVVPLAGAFPLAVEPPRPVAALPLEGGGDTAALIFDAEAAVGLLSLSATSLLGATFFAGVTGTGAFRALASEAAVGAKRPADGVLGREAPAGDPTALGRAEGVLAREGVFGREGVPAVEAAAFLAAAEGDMADEPVCCAFTD